MPIIFNQRTLSAITQTIKNGNLLIGILTANEYLQMEDPLRIALVRLVHQEKPKPSKILQMALDGLLAKDLPEGWQLDAQLYNR